MSEALDLLNRLSEEELAMYGAESDVEEHIVIGRDRFVTVPDSLKKIAVQYDHNIETVTFDCPRYWDEHDLSTMLIFVNYMTADGTPGSYRAKNIIVDDTDDSIFHFEWTISGNVTKKDGTINFLVCAKTITEDGSDAPHWNSELNTEMCISKGLETVETDEQMTPDLITQILLLNDNTMTRAGVYVGSGDMPDWASVQVDPEGEVYGHINAPTYGNVGRFLAVAKTDGEGKPTEWKYAYPQGVLCDYQCDYTNSLRDGVDFHSNVYPEHYFADHTTDPNVPEGQIHMAGKVQTEAKYATMSVGVYPTKKAVRMEFDMCIESLMIPASYTMWRGFVFEYSVPGSPLLYFALHGLNEDADGNNAILRVSKTERGAQDVNAPICIKYNEFQKWEIAYDGVGKVSFYIDGAHVLTVDGITAEATQNHNILLIKNLMFDVASGYNSVFFDHVRIMDAVEATDPTIYDWARQPNKPTYTPEEVGAQPNGDYIESPASASVGQMIRIKEVDENGKPTAWEAAHLPGVLVDYDCESNKDQQIVILPSDADADWSIHITGAMPGFPEYALLASTPSYVTQKSVKGYRDLRIPFTPNKKAIEMTFRMCINSLLTPSTNEMWRGLIFEYTTPSSPVLYFAMHRQDDLIYLGVSGSTRGVAEKSALIPDLIDTYRFIDFTVKYDGVSKATFYVDGTEILVVENITAASANTVSITSLQIRNCFMDWKSSYNSVYFDHIKIVDDPMPGIVAAVTEESVGDIENAVDEILSIQEELILPNGDEVAY